MASNYLKLNDDKTDFIIIGTKCNVTKVSEKTIKIGDSDIGPSQCIRNIGATFDPNLKMDEQITLTSKSAWFSLHQLGKIKRYLTPEQLKAAVHAFVTSRLDQNNSLLAGLPKSSLAKLKRVQHATARMLCGARKYDEVTPLLQSLHWLPIEQRIEFKTLLLVYKCLNTQGPVYLKDLLTPYKPTRSLRSASLNTLEVPRSHSTYGDRAFSIRAPLLWNAVPEHIRNCDSVILFKCQLKTYLFKRTFNC
jgi:hypothetical protein